jgi:hypothetical protein
MSKDEKKLLAQGLKDYVDVQHALTAFRELLKKTCGRVIEDNHREYAAALGIKPSDLRFKDYEWQEDRSEFYLGVQWTKEDPHVQILHCFMWTPSPREEGRVDTAIYAGLWSAPKNRALLRRELVREEGRKKKIITDDGAEGSDVYLLDALAPGDMGNIDVKLDKLTKKWIKLWKEVGGLKALGR